VVGQGWPTAKEPVSGLAIQHSRPNMSVELTGHSVGFFPFVGVVACGQQLTGSVSLIKLES
jgi:hypothetical protein